MALWHRFEMACAHAGEHGSSISRKLGVSTAYLSQLKAGIRPGTKRWKQIAEILGVDYEWLRTGTGKAPNWYSEVPSQKVPKDTPTALREPLAKYGDVTLIPPSELLRLIDGMAQELKDIKRQLEEISGTIAERKAQERRPETPSRQLRRIAQQDTEPTEIPRTPAP